MIGKLESPFKWNLNEDVLKKFDLKWLQNDEDIEIVAVMHSVMAIFILTIQEDYNEARRYIKKTDDLWNAVDHKHLQEEGISTQTVHCIIQGTKYEFFWATENTVEMKKLSEKMKKFKFPEDSVSLGTLNGCKSIAWSMCYELSGDEAISFARRAVIENPKCSTWHFILARYLRRSRRRSSGLSAKPSIEELLSFSRSFNLSKNPFFGIFFAQVLQENESTQAARYLLSHVHQMESQNLKVKLHLALAFLRFHDIDKAKECLDYVEKFTPESNMFLHYKGIWYKKQKKFEVASEYFKRASDNQNFGANLQYGLCMRQVDEEFSFIFHLFLMLKKFQNEKELKQQILLIIAIECYEENKLTKSLKYFIEAIKINPESLSLKKFKHSSNRELRRDFYNIFDFVEEKLMPKGYESNLTEVSPEWNDLCLEYTGIQIERICSK